MANTGSSRCVLGADVGGTKILLRLQAVADGRAGAVLGEARFESAAYASATPLIQSFLHGQPLPAAACLAVAAPVESRRVQLTNAALTVDADEIAEVCGIPQVTLINDFAAVAYGLESLQETDLVTLNPGAPVARAPRAVLGAGTGLGEAILFWQGDHYEVLPSEGGHVDFAPTDEEQIGLARFFMARHGHVSYERILSGSGLVGLFEYVTQGERVEPGLSAAVAREGAAAITRAALEEGHALATRALDLFVRIYGAQAGNLALTACAHGGLFVAGGIAARLPQRFARGDFLEAFLAKGRYRGWLERIPVRLVKRADVGVMGAVAVAIRLLSHRSWT
jgi:glucokinase